VHVYQKPRDQSETAADIDAIVADERGDEMKRLLIVVAIIAVMAVVAFRARRTPSKRIPDGIQNAPRAVPIDRLKGFNVIKKGE
jgi:hypothetical protein